MFANSADQRKRMCGRLPVDWFGAKLRQQVDDDNGMLAVVRRLVRNPVT